jgi:hypothetical protein
MVPAMLDYTRSGGKLAELRAAHRGTQEKREVDRIKAVVLVREAKARPLQNLCASSIGVARLTLQSRSAWPDMLADHAGFSPTIPTECHLNQTAMEVLQGKDR